MAKPKEPTIETLEQKRADLAQQLEAHEKAALQAIRAGGDLVEAQRQVNDTRAALAALDQALDDARQEQARQEQEQARAQSLEALRSLQAQREALTAQAREHAGALHDAIAQHLLPLQAARQQQRQLEQQVTAELRSLGGHLRHKMQMTPETEQEDYALLDDLSAQGLDLDVLLACPNDGLPKHHASRDEQDTLPAAQHRALLLRLLAPSPPPGALMPKKSA